MHNYKVAVVGATGMVGQSFITLLENHPWFHLEMLAASSRSAGKTYEEALGGRWKMTTPEEAYAKAECPVISNNSANRHTPDVPMIIPEINPDHAEVIAAQRKRLGTKRGFIAVKSNCSLQSYVPALHPLMKYGIKNVLACTYQAISGAGKTFETWPEMIDNVIPYIGGEEEKSEIEPLKIWGKLEDGKIVEAKTPAITTQCLRVPVSDGHTAAVFVSFDKKPTIDEIKKAWKDFKGAPQELNLPSAPKQFLNYFEEDNMPQTKLNRDLEGGMAISCGRLREDSQYDYKFVCLSNYLPRKDILKSNLY